MVRKIEESRMENRENEKKKKGEKERGNGKRGNVMAKNDGEWREKKLHVKWSGKEKNDECLVSLLSLFFPSFSLFPLFHIAIFFQHYFFYLTIRHNKWAEDNSIKR